MIQSDTLFRRTDYIINDTNNDDVVVLPNNIFIKAIDFDLQDAIQKLTRDDNLFAKALESIKHYGPVPIKLKLEEWSMTDGLWLFGGRCYIPPDESLNLITTPYLVDTQVT